LHYLLSRREDSAPYWHETGCRLRPGRLRELMVLWRHQPPSRYDLHRWRKCSRRPVTSTCFTAWVSGPSQRFSRRSDDADRADEFSARRRSSPQMLGALPSNRDLIDHIRKNGLQRI
jgi:hypothetical protein